ncbi:hypothetical protein [Arthrobacter sp. S41]|uniref:hypothetical protein n=1 Tax=Arthrobacter sp. S41 TaxID=2509721 RepID=UPI0010359CFC|nr:hypothetical protein [Arthrobacter sp. S41]TAP26847.1 hypothetical protein EYR88_00310 [Arthrobacter sp. S41]
MLNEHIIEAIWRTVEDGGDVVIVHRKPKAVLKQLAEDQRNAMRIYWVNGNERIDIDNGSSIDVIRESGHGRGLTANLLVLPLGINEALGVELMPILAPTQGHLLGY